MIKMEEKSRPNYLTLKTPVADAILQNMAERKRHVNTEPSVLRTEQNIVGM